MKGKILNCAKIILFFLGLFLPSLLCEKSCSVPRNRLEVCQFINGSPSRPVNEHRNKALPDGTRLITRCRDPGRERLIGDHSRTCHGGRWTGKEPKCKPVNTVLLLYGAPYDLAINGTFVIYVHSGYPQFLDVVCRVFKWSLRYPQLTTTLRDATVYEWRTWRRHIIRLSSITIESSGIFTCSKSSSWHSVHVIFKAAEHVECETPMVPQHGRIVNGSRLQSQDIFPSGSKISFECDVGYRLVGSILLTCQNGEWSDVPPFCEAVECKAPVAPQHGRIVDDNRPQSKDIFPNGSIVSFECDQGYRLVGSGLIRCENGEWSDVPPVCTAVECETPMVPENGRIVNGNRLQSQDIFPSGSNISFECDVGYRLVGYRLSRCENGEWSNDPPVCKRGEGTSLHRRTQLCIGTTEAVCTSAPPAPPPRPSFC